MDDKQREHHQRERRRLVFAESDMRQAAAAARHLEAFGARMNGDAERALWTGLIVTYVRPYLTSNEVGPIGGKLAKFESSEFTALHEQLLVLRRDWAAHNKPTELRGEVDVYAELGIGSGHYEESVMRLDAKAVPIIAELAEHQERRFRKRRDEVEEKLGRVRNDT